MDRELRAAVRCVIYIQQNTALRHFAHLAFDLRVNKCCLATDRHSLPPSRELFQFRWLVACSQFSRTQARIVKVAYKQLCYRRRTARRTDSLPTKRI